MIVEVRLFGEFREAVGKPALSLDLPEGADCEAALRELARREPKLSSLLFVGGALREHLQLFVNGENVNHKGGLRAKLSEGNVLTFFTLISGG